MDMSELKKTANAERKRLTKLLEDAMVSEARRRALGPVIDNTAWMYAKLEDTRTTIKSSQVAIPYDNGGGQSGIRENPLFKGYTSLWKAYMLGMGRILDALPAEVRVVEQDQEEYKPQTVLSLIRAKHGQEA